MHFPQFEGFSFRDAIRVLLSVYVSQSFNYLGVTSCVQDVMRLLPSVCAQCSSSLRSEFLCRVLLIEFNCCQSCDKIVLGTIEGVCDNCSFVGDVSFW